MGEKLLSVLDCVITIKSVKDRSTSCLTRVTYTSFESCCPAYLNYISLIVASGTLQVGAAGLWYQFVLLKPLLLRIIAKLFSIKFVENLNILPRYVIL